MKHIFCVFSKVIENHIVSILREYFRKVVSQLELKYAVFHQEAWTTYWSLYSKFPLTETTFLHQLKEFCEE